MVNVTVHILLGHKCFASCRHTVGCADVKKVNTFLENLETRRSRGIQNGQINVREYAKRQRKLWEK